MALRHLLAVFVTCAAALVASSTRAETGLGETPESVGAVPNVAADWHNVLRAVVDGLSAGFAAIPEIGMLVVLLDERPEGWDAASRGVELGHAIFLIIGLGFLGEVMARGLARLVRKRPSDGSDLAFPARLRRAMRALAFDLAAVAAFAAFLFLGVALWLAPSGPAYEGALAIIGAVVFFRLNVSGALFAFAPFAPADRLFAFTDRDARRVFLLFLVGFIFGNLFYGLTDLWTALGADAAALTAFGLTVGFGVMVYKIVMIMACRRPVRDAFLSSFEGAAPGGVRRAFAGVWHGVYVAIAIGVYFGAVIGATGAISGKLADGSNWAVATFLTDNYSLIFPIAIAVVLMGFEHAAQRAERAAMEPRAGLRAGALWRVGKKLSCGGLIIWCVILVGGAWGLEWTSGPVGSFVAQVVDAAVVLLAFWIGWEILKAYVDPHIDKDDGPIMPGEDMGGEGTTRLGTILPLFRGLIFALAISVGGLIALSNLGVNVAPLLAGAGVVGLAIGFGAQTLVRDIISGIFFLIDDAFRKGEYIETGDIRGTVERISLRSLQLRHHNGPVHTIPFGEIAHLTNYSRDWAIMKFEVRVPFEVDVEKVRKLIKKAGQEMAQDPEWAEMLIEPLKSQGVNRMDDSAFIVRCKFTAKPGKQFQLRRVAYAWVQKVFAENGIPFAPKRVIVETVSTASAAAEPAAPADATAPRSPVETKSDAEPQQDRAPTRPAVAAAAAGAAALASESVADESGGEDLGAL